MSNTAADYLTFQTQQKQLVDLFARALPLFQKLDMKGWADVTTKLAERLANERFRVIVLGEFKRGKSTFINALLQEEMLPAFVTPCTAVIGEVKWGEQKRAVLHFRNPLPTPLPEKIHQEASRHLEKSRTQPIVPPMDIDVRDLEQFVTIADPAQDKVAAVSESPFDRIELFWPLELCRNGVEIIDSPGLNEHRTRTKTTKDYLSYVDAVIFVMSVHALASESELAVIDHDVRGAGHEFVFFVCNRFDELRKAADRDQVTNYAYQKLTDRTRFGRQGIYFLSAQNALDGRTQGDAGLVERSGIIPLENALARFLVHDRGRVKLLQPASQLARGMKVALQEALPARLKMLQSDLQNLKQRYEEARPQLEQAAQRRDQVLHALDAYRMRLRETVRRAAQQFLRELAGMVPAWSSGLKTERQLNLLSSHTLEQQTKALVDEVVRGIQPKIDSAMAEWEKKELRVLLEQGLEELNQGVNTSLQGFLEQLDKVRSDLTLCLGSGVPQMNELTGKPISSLERVLAGAGGFFLLNPGAAVTGAALGYKGILQGLIPQFGAAFCALLLGVTNPVTLAGILLGAGLGQTIWKGNKMTEDAKLKIIQGIGNHMRETAPDRADDIGNQVYDHTDSLAKAIAEGLDREIQGVREQVEAVLKIKQAGETKVAQQRAELSTLEREWRALDAELTAMTFAIAQANSH